MNVILVIDRLKLYGAERVCRVVAEELSLSHDVTIVTYGMDEIHNIDLPARVRRVKLARPSNKLLALIVVLARLWMLFRSEPGAVAVSFMPLANCLAGLGRLGTGVRLIRTDHNLLSATLQNFRMPAALLRVVVRWFYDRADAAVAVSRDVADDLESQIGSSSVACHVIYNPIDVSHLLQGGAEWALECGDIAAWRDAHPGDQMLLMVGSLKYAKGYDIAIQALADMPKEFHLVAVGGGPLLTKLVALAGSLGLKERFHVVGPRSQVGAWMRASDLVIVPSRYEGFGLVAAEAYATGAGVLASDVPGLREVAKLLGIEMFKLSATALAAAVEQKSLASEMSPDRMVDGRELPPELRADVAVSKYESLLASVSRGLAQ